MICSWCHRETGDRASCDQCDRAPALRSEWHLQEVLGYGAASFTWRATRVEDERVVVIEELSVRGAEGLEQIETFEREAATLRDLDHPGIPRFYEHFVLEMPPDVRMYHVREFIEGDSLDHWRRPTPPEIVEMLKHLVDSVGYLARREPAVVHGDIKPTNVIRANDGRFVLIDFGSTSGTPGYAAPERDHQPTPASDLYSVAATAVALLTKRDAAEVVDPHNQGAWRDDLDIDPHLGDLLEEMLEVKLSWRLTDFEELQWRLSDLEARLA